MALFSIFILSNIDLSLLFHYRFLTIVLTEKHFVWVKGKLIGLFSTDVAIQ